MNFILSAVLKNKIAPHTYIFDLTALNVQTFKTSVISSAVANVLTGSITNFLPECVNVKTSTEDLDSVLANVFEFAQKVDKNLES